MARTGNVFLSPHGPPLHGLWAWGVALGLAAGAAAQLPKMTFLGADVPSDGRAWPHSTSNLNGVLSQTAGGSSFQLGELKISGTAHKVASPNNYPGQMHVMVRNITKGTSYASSNIFTNFNLPWTIVSANGKSFDASSLGTIDPGDQIEIRFYESYDDQDSPDSIWNNVVVELFAKPPSNTSGYTTFDLEPCPCEPIGTGNSDFGLAVAIYAENGDLVRFDDGMGSEPASVSLDGLPPMVYVVAITNAGAGFGDGFEVTPGPGTGTDGVVRLSREGAVFFETWAHDGDVVWPSLELIEVACPADLDGDGTVGLPDLAVLLGLFGTLCP